MLDDPLDAVPTFDNAGGFGFAEVPPQRHVRVLFVRFPDGFNGCADGAVHIHCVCSFLMCAGSGRDRGGGAMKRAGRRLSIPT